MGRRIGLKRWVPGKMIRDLERGRALLHLRGTGIGSSKSPVDRHPEGQHNHVMF